jgi:hypothetical protein
MMTRRALDLLDRALVLRDSREKKEVFECFKRWEDCLGALPTLDECKHYYLMRRSSVLFPVVVSAVLPSVARLIRVNKAEQPLAVRRRLRECRRIHMRVGGEQQIHRALQGITAARVIQAMTLSDSESHEGVLSATFTFPLAQVPAGDCATVVTVGAAHHDGIRGDSSGCIIV